MAYLPRILRGHAMNRRIVLASLGLVVIAAVAIRVMAAADQPIPPPLKKDPPTSFECRFTETPPVIDGEANDAAWKSAEVIDAFHLPWLGDKARMSRTSTKARLLWD